MTISLGGAPGPRDGRHDDHGRRGPPQASPAPEKAAAPVTPPAAKTPEMALPTKRSRPTPKPSARLRPREARALPKAREATQEASAVTETGATGQGFGLTTGGSGTGGYLDVANFCCPEYLTTMMQLIQRNWNGEAGRRGQTLDEVHDPARWPNH